MGGAVALFSVLAVEIFSFAALCFLEGRLFAAPDFQAIRSYILDPRNAQPPATGDFPLATPHAEILHPYLGFIVDPTARDGYSDYGFPGGTTPFTTAEDRRLVVGIFGGSFAEGLWREGRETLVEELRRWKPWADRGIVVEPLALGGYKQPQQLMSLAWFLSIGARFDAVVNLDGFNEVALAPAENAGEVFPFYPRGWPARVGNFIDPRKLSLVARMDAIERRQTSLARLFSRFPLSWSMTANLVWRSLQVRVSTGRAALSQELKRLAASRKGKLGYLASGPPADYPDDHAMYEALAATWARSSRGMHDLAAARGILYLHDLQPNQYAGGSKPMSRREREVAWQEDHPYRKGVVAGYPLLAAKGKELRREGIDFHDLTGIFRDHPEPLYVDSCCHVSREGYEIVAREIGRELVALAGSGR